MTAPRMDATRCEKKPPPPEDAAEFCALGGGLDGGFLSSPVLPDADLPEPEPEPEPVEVGLVSAFFALAAVLAVADLAGLAFVGLAALEVVFSSFCVEGFFLTSVAFKLMVAVGRFEREWGVFFFHISPELETLKILSHSL